MAPLSKLTLTSYRRTQPNRDPIEERRSKTLAALAQQKLVLEAALKGQEHTFTKPGWARDANGNRQRVEKIHAVRPWFFQVKHAPTRPRNPIRETKNQWTNIAGWTMLLRKTFVLE